MGKDNAEKKLQLFNRGFVSQFMMSDGEDPSILDSSSVWHRVKIFVDKLIEMGVNPDWIKVQPYTVLGLDGAYVREDRVRVEVIYFHHEEIEHDDGKTT